MKNVYFISGLGADERVFDFQKPENFNLNFIRYIKPSKDDDIQSYVKKLSAQIKHKKEIVLIGLSFGGLIAIELSKINMI